MDLIRSGVPGGPRELTLGQLYPQLWQRLSSKGLPQPNQRGDDLVSQFVFTRNAAWRVGVDPADVSSGDGLERHLVVITTTHYEDSHYPTLEISAEIQGLAKLLTDERRLGARVFLPAFPELADDPTPQQIRETLRWGLLNGCDALVLLVAGHCEVLWSDYWLVLRDSESANLAESAFRMSDFLRQAARGARDIEHVLMIIDVGYAGAATLTDRLEFHGIVPDSWLVLISQNAAPGALTEAVTRAIVKLYGPEGGGYGRTGLYISASDFVDAVRESLPGEEPVLLYRGAFNAPLKCLPRPYAM